MPVRKTTSKKTPARKPAKRTVAPPIEEEINEEISPSPTYDYQYTQPKKNYLTPILVVLLILASFLIGNLYTRVKLLEKNGPTAPTAAAADQAAAPVVKQDLKVADTDPSQGPKDAKVTVITFEDFQCPFCGAVEGKNQELVTSMQSRDATWQPAIPGIINDYVKSGKVRLVWKDYPFLGDESFWAAEAAWCAHDQGKFWEMHDKIFSSQKGENEGAFSKDNLKKFAADIGLDTSKFNSCFDGGNYTQKIKDAKAYGDGVGVSGTPATFVNGKMISGAASYATFKTEIDAALQ